MKRGRGGVRFEDLTSGTGPPAARGSSVEIRYDLSPKRGETVESGRLERFRLGERRVIPGLEYGVEGMRGGGRRRIRIGPHLAYGERGVPSKVPANAVLVFDVLLLDVRSVPDG